MVNQELLAYVRASLSQGATFDAIRSNLKTAGWTDADVDEVIKIVNNPLTNIPSMPPSVLSVSTAGDPGVKKKSYTGIIIFFIIFILLLGLSGVTYFYFPQLIPFGKKAPYNENNFLSGLSFKLAQIKTLKSSEKIEINVGPKEANVKPLPTIEGEEVPLGEEALLFFPKELSVGLVAEMDFSKPKSDWSINLDAVGDFFETTYKFNMDFLLKGEDYFFRVNDMPAIYPEINAQFEDIWYTFNFDSIDKYVNDTIAKAEAEGDKEAAEELRTQYAEYKTQIDEIERSYENLPKRFADHLKNVILTADEVKLIKFKNAPEEIQSEGQTLYKYELTAEREEFIKFVQRVLIESTRDEIIRLSKNEEEAKPQIEEMTKLINGEDFKNIIGFLYDNGSVSVIVDDKGYPHSIEQNFKILLSAESQEQINVNYTIGLSNINKPVNIEAPTGAKDIFETVSKSLDVARSKAANAQLKSSLSSLRAEAEIFYSNKNSYGKSSLSGSCTTPNTLFTSGDTATSMGYINQAVKDKATLRCFSSSKAWAMSAPIVDTGYEKGYWCVDSTGASKQMANPASATVCQ